MLLIVWTKHIFFYIYEDVHIQKDKKGENKHELSF